MKDLSEAPSEARKGNYLTAALKSASVLVPAVAATFGKAGKAITAAAFKWTQAYHAGRNANLLKAAMKRAGEVFAEGEHAHHIVASTHKDAQRARDILNRFKIDINSAENGIRLSEAEHLGDLRSLTAIQQVTDMLSRATTRDQAVGMLHHIADLIREKEFPF